MTMHSSELLYLQVSRKGAEIQSELCRTGVEVNSSKNDVVQEGVEAFAVADSGDIAIWTNKGLEIEVASKRRRYALTTNFLTPDELLRPSGIAFADHPGVVSVATFNKRTRMTSIYEVVVETKSVRSVFQARLGEQVGIDVLPYSE